MSPDRVEVFEVAAHMVVATPSRRVRPWRARVYLDNLLIGITGHSETAYGADRAGRKLLVAAKHAWLLAKAEGGRS